MLSTVSLGFLFLAVKFFSDRLFEDCEFKFSKFIVICRLMAWRIWNTENKLSLISVVLGPATHLMIEIVSSYLH